MKISRLIVLMLVLILAGCNLPQETQAPPPEAVAVAVALTLTAQPSATVAVTSTSLPQATTLPPQITVTPSATIAPTETSTATATATLPSNDPAVQLGAPTGRDVLDTGKGFGLSSGSYKDDYSSWQISGGVLTIQSFMSNGWHSWRLRPPKIKNFYLQTILTPQSCAGKDLFGLVFRAPNYESGQGYYLGITCDGQFRLDRWVEDQRTVLIQPSASVYLNSGLGQTNRLGVLVQGSEFAIYANGNLVQEVSDTGISDAGYYGLYVAGFSGGLIVQADEIAYWSLP